MKKILLLLVITLSTVSYSQTEITDANFQDAIETCLFTNPVNGLCTSSEYGAMPDWDVSQVTDMSNAFKDRDTFNADITAWDVSNVTNMVAMFRSAIAFNQPIGDWVVSSVTNMSYMFTYASTFNQPIGDWVVSSVTNMSYMFYGASSFDQDINTKQVEVEDGENYTAWNVSNVTTMEGMLASSSFNKPIGDWDVSNVTDMSLMFYNASSFDQDINTKQVEVEDGENYTAWNVSNVTTMVRMLASSSFNQPIGDWDVSNVTNMGYMFDLASFFDQDIGNWDVSKVTDMLAMFDSSALSTHNYDRILNNWSGQELQQNVTLSAQGINYCDGASGRQKLIDDFGWTITDGGIDCSTASIEDQTQLDISIYPNPTSDIVYIDGNYTQLKVVIYNILGKEVINKSITNSIDISHLENGVYLMKLSDGFKLYTRKVIKN